MDTNNNSESKIFMAMVKSKSIKKYIRNHFEKDSGRFDSLPRFTKFQNYLLESLYSISDLRNPSSYRIYLYLLRKTTGYINTKYIEYRPKIMKTQMNMGNAFYNAVNILQDKNMIRYYDKEGVKQIGLNPYPDTWITSSNGRIAEIINKECNAILGVTDDAPLSSSSSSWSSSSTSSKSYINLEKLSEDDLLKELEKF